MYEHLFKDLEPTEAEAKVIEAAARGDIADFRTGNENEDDPANAEKWGEERKIRAEVIFALLVEGRADWPVHPQGIWIYGAEITGALDLPGAELAFPLSLLGCRLNSTVLLYDCRAKSLNFSDSRLFSIRGDRLTVTGSLYMRGNFIAEGEVRLLGAMIGGDLDCSGATFESVKGPALIADNIDVKGSVILEKCLAKGEVRFVAAIVGGFFDFSEATLENADGPALNADGLDVRHNANLTKCVAKSEVRFLSAVVGGDLSCAGATFENGNGAAFSADRINVKGNVNIGKCTAEGTVRFAGASIGGHFQCTDAILVSPEDIALQLQGAKVI